MAWHHMRVLRAAAGLVAFTHQYVKEPAFAKKLRRGKHIGSLWRILPKNAVQS
jgi:hypothetical protein